jgi:hypothetical protein
MNREKRTSLNQERLALVDETIRPKVQAVLTLLEYRNYQPLIASEVFRSPQKQLELFQRGVTKVRWGFHCATTRDGQAGSLAADIIDADKGWNMNNEFWLRLGKAAFDEGLHWGGFFGLTRNLERLLVVAFNFGDPVEYFRQQRLPLEKVKKGWDPAHLEVKGLSIAEARAGVRLKF